MTSLKRILLVMTFLAVPVMLLPYFVAPPVTIQPKQNGAQPAAGIAVVELFTSQGCSSCPPADDFLSKLAQAADKQNLAIYPLSLHVDYWNHLGWEDPYSLAVCSERQRKYASHWNSQRVYTPQMVVNGTQEFVGSNQQAAETVITSALETEPRVALSLNSMKASGHWLNVDYKSVGIRTGDMIHFAVVQNPQPKLVDRGENRGRELKHVNVVRTFETIIIESADCQSCSSLAMPVPNDVDMGDVRVIAYVQEIQSQKIVGAAISAR